MSEEEIKALAESLGLEPSRLKIFEPYYNRNIEATVYALEYDTGRKLLGWNYAAYRDDYDRALYMLPYAVKDCLQHIADKIKREG